jgi:hypothetical protein
MKPLLTALLLVACLVGKGQGKPFKWPKPIRDSTYTKIDSDTLYGTIEYAMGPGRVVGHGMIVTRKFTHYTRKIYTAKDQAKIDAYRKTQFMWVGDGGYSLSSEDQEFAYIKIQDGWQPVIKRYTFYPYSKEGILDSLLKLFGSFLGEKFISKFKVWQHN